MKREAVRGNAESIVASLIHCISDNRLSLYRDLITLRTDIALTDVDHFISLRESDGLRPANVCANFLANGSSALRYSGEKKGQLAEVEKELFGMSQSFRKPLNMLRQQYHGLSR